MSATVNRTTSEKGYSKAIIDEKVKNYENDPFFVKKANEANEILKKVGLPRQTKK